MFGLFVRLVLSTFFLFCSYVTLVLSALSFLFVSVLLSYVGCNPALCFFYLFVTLVLGALFLICLLLTLVVIALYLFCLFVILVVSTFCILGLFFCSL